MIALGITHIDTSGFYGPFVTNEIIKEAPYPYPENVRMRVGGFSLAEPGSLAEIDPLASQDIAYLPYSPLGGFIPLQSGTLDSEAKRLDAAPMASPWRGCCSAQRTSCSSPPPHRSPRCHENVVGAGLELSEADRTDLDSIGAEAIAGP